MRALLLAAALLAAAVVTAPAAVAQVPTHAPSTTSLKIDPFDGPLERESVFVTKGVVTYSYFVLGMTALTSTKISLKVLDAPAWAVVTLNPSTLIVPVTGGGAGLTVTAPPQDFTISVTLLDDAPAGTPGTIRIVATAHPNAPIGPSQADEDLLVQVAKDAPCHHGEDADAAGAVPVTEASSDTVTTSSFEAAPAGSAFTQTAAILGAIGLAGGAGVAWRLRRRA